MKAYSQFKYIIIIFVIIVICAFIGKHFFHEKYPYEKIESLVTSTERAFLIALLSVVDANTYVFSKVRLADIVKVKKGTKDYIKYFSKIQSKHVDFLLCDSVDFSPVLAIELDDPSHDSEDAKARDDVKNNVLDAASIPLLRIKPKKNYNLNNLKRAIDEQILN